MCCPSWAASRHRADVLSDDKESRTHLFVAQISREPDRVLARPVVVGERNCAERQIGAVDVVVIQLGASPGGTSEVGGGAASTCSTARAVGGSLLSTLWNTLQATAIRGLCKPGAAMDAVEPSKAFGRGQDVVAPQQLTRGLPRWSQGPQSGSLPTCRGCNPRHSNTRVRFFQPNERALGRLQFWRWICSIAMAAVFAKLLLPLSCKEDFP